MLFYLKIPDLPTPLTYRRSTSLGIAVSIGLIFHKLPEGFVISAPFYSTNGSQWKSFALGFIATSFFMFLGAILSYVVFTNYWDGFAAGAILSFAAGILFFLGSNVILPLAFKLDPENQVTSLSFVIGVLIIFVSESILSYAE